LAEVSKRISVGFPTEILPLNPTGALQERGCQRADLSWAAWDSGVLRRGCRRPAARDGTARGVTSQTGTATTSDETSYECDISQTTNRPHCTTTAQHTSPTRRSHMGPGSWDPNTRKKTSAKERCFIKHIHTARKAVEITPRQGRNGPVCHCVTSFAASAFHSVAAGGYGRDKRVFVSGDLDL